MPGYQLESYVLFLCFCHFCHLSRPLNVQNYLPFRICISLTFARFLHFSPVRYLVLCSFMYGSSFLFYCLARLYLFCDSFPDFRFWIFPLQPWILSLSMSSNTCSSHRLFCRFHALLKPGFHYVTFFITLSSSILLMWSDHHSVCVFTTFTMSSPCTLFLFRLVSLSL